MAVLETSDEQIQPVEAQISGTIPEWLEGSYLTIGPGVFDLDSGFTVNHFFDGYAVLCKFDIHNGKVMFSKRYLQSEAYKGAQQTGKPVTTEFDTKAYPNPTKGILEAVMDNFIPDLSDNCNVRIIKLGNSYFASNTTAIFMEIDPLDLSTRKQFDIFRLYGISSACFNRCDNYAVGVSTGSVHIESHPKYHVVKFKENSESGLRALQGGENVAIIRSRWRDYISVYFTFGSTRDYIVFIEQPYKLNVFDALDVRIKGQTLNGCTHWSPHETTRFYLVEKLTGKVIETKYETESFFFFHTINAYEENEEIKLDVIGYDDASVIDQLKIRNIRSNTPQLPSNRQARRYTIPIFRNIAEVAEDVNLVRQPSDCTAIRRNDAILLNYRTISPGFHELPTVNLKYYGLKYRFYYAIETSPSQNELFVIKIEVETSIITRWRVGENQICSEPLFVERINSKSEDDGVLLVCITSSLPHHDDRLVILDATNMQVIATASVPCHVPVNIFGLFINK